MTSHFKGQSRKQTRPVILNTRPINILGSQFSITAHFSVATTRAAILDHHTFNQRTVRQFYRTDRRFPSISRAPTCGSAAMSKKYTRHMDCLLSTVFPKD